MAFKPTRTQERAIFENGNILVSAAAGSGKTAVLVERVINRLSDRENPVRADELLIVTFTNAAAAEMRSRIEKRLDEECRKTPDNTALLLQKHLLANAKICTIDSFCIDLVRENFDKLDIAPDFKIEDAATLRAIDEEVLYSIINNYFEEKNPLFFELLDIVGSEFDEKNFAELILSLYEFSRQLPFPNKWFDEILDNYNGGSFTSESIWQKYAFISAGKTVDSMKNLISVAINDISNVETAYNAYYSAFSDAREQILELEKMLNTGEWDTFYNALSNFKLQRMPSVRGMSDFPTITAAKDTYKFLGSKACENLKKIFFSDSAFINSQHKKIYEPLKLLVSILKDFSQKLFEEYKRQNVFTFHNTEHLALELLYSEKHGEITDSAKELIGNFKEIMVDEYQDTNDLQNMLFYVLSDFERKLFVVGDVKQSIYAFRGANPINFLNKKNRSIDIENACENDPKKIILGNNFRSCAQVCDFVNFFFGIFMQSYSGNIEYGEEEQLIPTAAFPDTNESAVSFDIIDCSESDEKGLLLEARRIAQFIKQTMTEPCIKADDSNLRTAKYSDFAILLRSVSNKAPLLVSELKRQGIPVNLSVGEFSQSTEISTFLSLLKIIDNPQSDVELVTAMMSPIFSFSTDEMAVIRSDKKDGNLYSAVIFAANNGNIHAKEFLEKLEKFRLDATTLPLDKLISKLLITTEYLNIATAMSDGEKRRNNLLLLCDYAKQYIQNRTASLSGFINFILKQSESLSVGATTANSDAVKIMSIHASKGLQFPVCIIASCASRFNDAESRSSAAYSVKYGLGFKYFDEDDKQKYTTLAREVILDDIKKSALEEELRLLYVAMTRAQDKLHFVSSFSNFQRALEGYKNLVISSQNRVDYGLFSRTKSYADWLMVALLLHPDGKLFRNNSDGILCLDSCQKLKINLINGANLSENFLSENIETFVEDAQLVTTLQENFSFEYPYKALSSVQSKLSVSVLANKAESEKYSFTSKPSFLSIGGITATGRGTAMHKVMEFFDFEKSDFVDEEIERLYEWQFISEDEKNSLDIGALKKFFESEIFGRIKNSALVKREMRFITELPATEIDANLDSDFCAEKIVVQGAVDVCFVENDALVILDFKTDRVDDIQDLAISYGEQLSVYAKACEKIFGKKVKEKVIYSFAKSDIVVI